MPAIVHRTTNNGTAKQWISALNCWHLDTWFYLVQDTPILLARTSLGGVKPLGCTAWELARDKQGFGLWELARVLPAPRVELLERTGELSAPFLITSPAGARAFGSPEQADIAFKCTARPLGGLWPRGDYPRRSIRHHMVTPVYADNPCDTFRNMYAETGRAERDIAFAQLAR